MQSKQFMEDKLKQFREVSKLSDGTELLRFMIESAPKMSDEERKTFLEVLREGFEKSGQLLIERALFEGVMTEKEYQKLKDKYKLSDIDFSTILGVYFARKDKHFKDDEKVIVTTMSHSQVYKHRKFLQKRFNLDIRSVEESLKLLRGKENKK